MRVDCDDCGEIFEEKQLEKGPYDNMICHRCGIAFAVEQVIEECLRNPSVNTANNLHHNIMNLIDLEVAKVYNDLTQSQAGDQ